MNLSSLYSGESGSGLDKNKQMIPIGCTTCRGSSREPAILIGFLCCESRITGLKAPLAPAPKPNGIFSGSHFGETKPLVRATMTLCGRSRDVDGPQRSVLKTAAETRSAQAEAETVVWRGGEALRARLKPV